MTAIAESVERGTALLDDQLCEATSWYAGEPCGAPAFGFFRRACVHEHVRDGWLCQHHAEVEQPVCLDCSDLGGGLSHECPVILVPLEVAAP